MSKKNEKALNLNYNPELARKFQEASLKKTGIQDFIKEFIVQFLSEDTKTAYIKDLRFFLIFYEQVMFISPHRMKLKVFNFNSTEIISWNEVCHLQLLTGDLFVLGHLSSGQSLQDSWIIIL